MLLRRYENIHAKKKKKNKIAKSENGAYTIISYITNLTWSSILSFWEFKCFRLFIFSLLTNFNTNKDNQQFFRKLLKYFQWTNREVAHNDVGESVVDERVTRKVAAVNIPCSVFCAQHLSFPSQTPEIMGLLSLLYLKPG